MKKKHIGLILLVALWAILTVFAWFGPTEEMSVWERRKLEQFPKVTWKSIMGRKFMEDFEDYTLDQFPLRNAFRTLKAVNHYFVLQQQDNNGIYMAEDHVAEMAYPLDTDSVNHAIKQFNLVYDLYLQDAASIHVTVVPDKGYYLAEENGYLSLNYDTMFSMVREGMPWAEYVDITGALELEDYYYTDTHWRQEKLGEVSGLLAQALGVTTEESYTVTELERPFYGVYYGQAALPLQPETMYILESDLLKDCRVYDYNTDSYGQVYDMTRLEGNDMYEVFLSGAQSMLRIENPNAATDKELIVFRDSYGSSLIPLLVKDYAVVTLLDIRYVIPQNLGNYISFGDQDVLFMYSTLVLNKSLI